MRVQITELPQRSGSVDIGEAEVLEDAAVTGVVRGSGQSVLPKGSRLRILVDAEQGSGGLRYSGREVLLSRLEDSLNGEARNRYKADKQYLTAVFNRWETEEVTVEKPESLPLYGSIIRLRRRRGPGNVPSARRYRALVCSVSFGYRDDLSSSDQGGFPGSGDVPSAGGIRASCFAVGSGGCFGC